MAQRIDWDSQLGRRLRLRDLHVLMTIARLGSMAKAAAELGAYFSGGGVSKPEHAWGAYAMLFGALVLMRATDDAGLRNEMRQCVAANLERLAAK